MSRFIYAALCCAVLVGFANLTAVGEDKAPAAPTAEQQAAMMQAFMTHSTPGPKHKELEKMIGDWDCEIESYEPTGMVKSKGSAKRTMILGGRFLQEEFKGTHMGMPFEGLMLLGYDNTMKKQVGIWVDSMSTSVASLTETESSPKMSKMMGKMTCPIEKKEISFRTETKIIDDNSQEFSMFMTPPGMDKEMLGMKITFTRKK